MTRVDSSIPFTDPCELPWLRVYSLFFFFFKVGSNFPVIKDHRVLVSFLRANGEKICKEAFKKA